jgi:hypothetical protein
MLAVTGAIQGVVVCGQPGVSYVSSANISTFGMVGGAVGMLGTVGSIGMEWTGKPAAIQYTAGGHVIAGSAQVTSADGLHMWTASVQPGMLVGQMVLSLSSLEQTGTTAGEMGFTASGQLTATLVDQAMSPMGDVQLQAQF